MSVRSPIAPVVPMPGGIASLAAVESFRVLIHREAARGKGGDKPGNAQ